MRAQSALILVAAAAVLSGAARGASPPLARTAGSVPWAGSASVSGGAPVGGPAPTTRPRRKLPKPPSRHSHGHWLSGVLITEYWPAPERWFVGRPVRAPGLRGRHRIDWLYSALGVSMEGDGVGLDGRTYHLDSPGAAGWVTRAGAATSPSGGWSTGPPYWRAGGYWQNGAGAVTFPLARGGWSNGRGHHYVSLPGITFARGPSLPLHFFRSLAVDPSVIPLGSRIYIPAYRHDGYGGWFVAADTGGAITGRHVDVYRTPPASPTDSGQYLTGQRVYVIKPRGHH